MNNTNTILAFELIRLIRNKALGFPTHKQDVNTLKNISIANVEIYERFAFLDVNMLSSQSVKSIGTAIDLLFLNSNNKNSNTESLTQFYLNYLIQNKQSLPVLDYALHLFEKTSNKIPVIDDSIYALNVVLRNEKFFSNEFLEDNHNLISNFSKTVNSLDIDSNVAVLKFIKYLHSTYHGNIELPSNTILSEWVANNSLYLNDINLLDKNLEKLLKNGLVTMSNVNYIPDNELINLEANIIRSTLPNILLNSSISYVDQLTNEIQYKTAVVFILDNVVSDLSNGIKPSILNIISRYHSNTYQKNVDAENSFDNSTSVFIDKISQKAFHPSTNNYGNDLN